jgi:hypothetical protein
MSICIKMSLLQVSSARLAVSVDCSICGQLTSPVTRYAVTLNLQSAEFDTG